MPKSPSCTCGDCRKCKARERTRLWRLANPERVKQYADAYRKQHRSQFAVYSREWDARNAEQRTAINAAYKASPAGRVATRAQARRHFDRKREWLDSFKRGPCVDCRQKYPPYVYDFDHVRGTKAFALGAWMNGKVKATKEQVLAEIAKCELRCANCHRIRHREQIL